LQPSVVGKAAVVNGGSAIYYSADGGKTFEKISAGLPTANWAGSESTSSAKTRSLSTQSSNRKRLQKSRKTPLKQASVVKMLTPVRG
jgi:hypothetical protein